MDQYQEAKSAAAANIIPLEHIAWLRLKASPTEGMMTVDILQYGAWNSIDLPKEEAIAFAARLKQFRSSKVE